MTRALTQNHYSEEFKRNTVAVIRAGMSIYNVSKRLSIPINTVSYWMGQVKYKDVQPATEEVLKALPMSIPLKLDQKSSLVPITKTPKNESPTICSIKMNIGKLQIECSNENLVPVLKAFGEAGVL